MNLSIPATPAFVVDRDVVDRNTRRMLERAARSACAFRPHVKTHKTVEIARMQHGGGVGPITVSTLAEAEFFAVAGFSDITYAVPIAPDKLQRVVKIASEVDRLNILVDHWRAVEAIEEFGRNQKVAFDVFLKVDCGYHRAGVDPSSRSSVELARRIASSPGIRFRGLLTHAGHSYHGRSRDEIAAVATMESEAVTKFRTVLEGEGIQGLIRSTGSTPTMSLSDRFADTDEARPGNYVFYDAFQAAVGSCTLEDCACSVLTTVIGNYPEQRKILVDAGALAMSKDRGADHLDPSVRYGTVCDLEMRPQPLDFTSMSQEHGQIFLREGTNSEAWPVGSRLRIVPNHSCLTAALHDRYLVVENGRVRDEWKPARGW